MSTIIHRSNTRGFADLGWLKTNHTFSFGSYFNPERIQFGALRVLNDDEVAPGMGFGTHPHKNMEIISIPLEGELEHRDSMGNVQVIKTGDVQVMSAGSGIEHSEYNRRNDVPVKFLQIWILPDKKGVEPRYAQMNISDYYELNKLTCIISPESEKRGLWIHQNAYMYIGTFEKEKEFTYESKGNNRGIYLFVISGKVWVHETVLDSRDGMGVEEKSKIPFKSLSDNTRLLLIDVPMPV